MDIDEPVDAGTAAVAGDTSTEGGSTRHTRESTEILAERPPKRTKTDGSTSNPPKKGKRPYKRGQYGEGEGDIRPADCGNHALEHYYKGQGIVGDDEWETLLQCMKSSLPLAVRISLNRPERPSVIQHLRKQPHCAPISWFPDELAWRCSHNDYHSRENANFKSWVQETNGSGGLTFQEEVSMLPPILLAPLPDSTVLDMCAAPGSKTSELLEEMHRADDWDESGLPRLARGVVVANDLSAKRVNNIMLPRLRKMHSPCVVSTVANGAKMPVLAPHDDGTDSSPALFDRILVDAPCSGDGTIRKEPIVWRRWHAKDGVEMHACQVRLLCRAIALLRVGGRLVYSTCSLNPLENEAVVCAALTKYGVDRVQLEAPGHHMPKGLRYRPGLREWKVADPRGGDRWLDAAGPYPEPVSYRSKQPIKASMFPPTSVDVLDQVGHCVRLLPHDNDAGGFFCAVFVKTKTTGGDWSSDVGRVVASGKDIAKDGAAAATSIESTERKGAVQMEQGEAAVEMSKMDDSSLPRLVEGGIFQDKQRFRELSQDDEECCQLVKFYGLAGPLILFSFTDKKDDDRKIVAVSGGLREWLAAFTKAKGRLKFKQVQIASFGLRVFKRLSPGYAANAGSRWRPCQEGTPMLAKVARRRKILLPPAAFLVLLEQKRIVFEEFMQLRDSVVGWDSIASADESEHGLEFGGVIVGLQPSDVEIDCTRMWVAALLNTAGLDTFVSKNELGGIAKLLKDASGDFKDRECSAS